MKILGLVVACIIFTTEFACSQFYRGPEIDVSKAKDQIVKLATVKKVPESYRKVYDRYTAIKAPNGNNIHIFIQSDLSTDKVLYCRSLLKFYLTPNETKYGAKKFKDALANNLASSGAILSLLNGTDGENHVRLSGQPLFDEEIIVPGSDAYKENRGRDASFEEILHFVHDFGIGVDGKHTFPVKDRSHSTFQKKLREATNNALKNKIWGTCQPRAKGWLDELAEENSLTQEYFATLVDVYYGLWAHSNEGTMGGEYICKTREEIKRLDPKGWEILNLIFPSKIYSELHVVGKNFSYQYVKFKPYTLKSQYIEKPQNKKR